MIEFLVVFALLHWTVYQARHGALQGMGALALGLGVVAVPVALCAALLVWVLG